MVKTQQKVSTNTVNNKVYIVFNENAYFIHHNGKLNKLCGDDTFDNIEVDETELLSATLDKVFKNPFLLAYYNTMDEALDFYNSGEWKKFYINNI